MKRNLFLPPLSKRLNKRPKKYVSIYRERNDLPFAKVYPYFFSMVQSVEPYEYVFKNWDGSIHADEDGVITIGEALL